MGLKDFLSQKSAEHLEKEREARELAEKKEREAREQTELDAAPVPQHPLRGQDDVLEDYMLGQLILRDEMPPQDAEGRQPLLLARSLGFGRGRFDEISQKASLYDDQAKAEHLEKLGGILLQNDEIDCFLCDIVFLHGGFDEQMQNFWRTVCFGVFKLDEIRVASLENLCRMVSGGRQYVYKDAIGNVSEEVIDYCLAWNPSVVIMETFLVIDLSGGKKAEEYSFRYTNRPPKSYDDVCSMTELWFRRIPAGTFMMGSPSDELGSVDDECQHQVTLTHDFYIGLYPVTQRQWELVMGKKLKKLPNIHPSILHAQFQESGPSAPMEIVSYDDICGPNRPWPSDSTVSSDSFLGRLRSKTGLDGFDLPTEAQWEYACRAGTVTALNSGMDLTRSGGICRTLDAVGWYDKNSNGQTHPVGQKQPNAWGLYDMHGNVREWCRDWYGDYPSESVTDPCGPVAGSVRVQRGGGYDSRARDCRAASRNYDLTISDWHALGFRLVFCAGNGDNGNQISGEGRALDVKYGTEEGKVSESRTGIVSRWPPTDSKKLPKKMSLKK